ncbi:MAG: C39 family peptidase, partial [Gordonibacter urolithinfaciens]
RLAIAVVAVVLVIALVAGVRGCMAAGEAAPVPDEADQAPVQQQAPRDPIDEGELKAVLGDELAARLVQAAETSDDAVWIAAHPDAYAVDGAAVQYKLLKLAATVPEALPFVRTFPDAYPAESALGTDDPASGQVPRLYQWDARWGSTVYSSTAFALTGCCPTSLAMVYQGLTGKGDLSPYDMGRRASEGGYETQFDGTDATFLVSEAASLGLSCKEVAADAASVRAALEGGAVLICNVGPATSRTTALRRHGHHDAETCSTTRTRPSVRTGAGTWTRCSARRRRCGPTGSRDALAGERPASVSPPLLPALRSGPSRRRFHARRCSFGHLHYIPLSVR